MVVTSVVTYTFSIDSFVVSPWSRYGPSVDWGVHSNFIIRINPDNTVQGDYGEVSCDVTCNTYSSVLTV